MENNKKKSSLPLLILTPLVVLLICTAVLIVAAIKPYNKLSVYLNLAFMDEFRTKPTDGTNGLIIVENDIKTEHSGSYSDEGEVVRPSFGEQFAVLRSEALGESVPVYWGSNRKLFERGACQASFSKLPGDVGNTVISAHEDTYFNKLSSLEVGDTVTINTNYGEFVYTVKEKISFKKTNKKYVNPSDEVKLTLYTCKKDVLGSSDERVGVVCELTEKKFYTEAEEEGTET